MRVPNILCSDREGRIHDFPAIEMAGRSGWSVERIRPEELIELPSGSQLYYLPERPATGFDRKSGRKTVLDDAWAVAAFVPPSYTHFLLAAGEARPNAPRLPLFSYTAVGWLNGRYYVPAIRMDEDVKHSPSSFDGENVSGRVEAKIREHPANRLLAHHGRICALRYGCPNAKNLFLNRWEAPVAVAAGCNANCLGCISFQPKDSVTSPQDRLSFVPTQQEIVELAVPHLETADRAIVSFGQGCEGEPLLHDKLIEAAIREIRSRTSRGILHINTNGSCPDALERLFAAGLDSVRVSMNSAQPSLYERYYRPNNYSFDDVRRSLITARRHGRFASINYFVFPGITDSHQEIAALREFLRSTDVDLIQWRNFNIDPDWYLSEVCRDYSSSSVGVRSMLRLIKDEFPHLQYGYLNKHREAIEAFRAAETSA